jgi:hypothetical protein
VATTGLRTEKQFKTQFNFLVCFQFWKIGLQWKQLHFVTILNFFRLGKFSWSYGLIPPEGLARPSGGDSVSTPNSSVEQSHECRSPVSSGVENPLGKRGKRCTFPHKPKTGPKSAGSRCSKKKKKVQNLPNTFSVCFPHFSSVLRPSGNLS